MPKNKGYFGVKSGSKKTGNTVKTDRAPNASGNAVKTGNANASGNTMSGLRTLQDGGKP